jgi:hypothetical protein
VVEGLITGGLLDPGIMGVLALLESDPLLQPQRVKAVKTARTVLFGEAIFIYSVFIFIFEIIERVFLSCLFF